MFYVNYISKKLKKILFSRKKKERKGKVKKGRGGGRKGNRKQGFLGEMVDGGSRVG